MAKTVLITDLTKLAAAIISIKGRSAKLDSDIHIAAVSAVAHFAKCGDVGYINRLYLALGKGARHVAFIEWVTQFGGVSANEGDSKDTTPFIKDKGKTPDIEGGDAMPWYNCKRSPKPDEVLDYYALLMKLVTKKAKKDQTCVHAELLAKITPILKEYEETVLTVVEPAGDDDTEE